MFGLTLVSSFASASVGVPAALAVGIFARAKQMLVCCVAPLVERCDTWLWLLSAWFPQNCVVLVSGYCGVALWIEDCSRLVSASCCATSRLRYAVVGLAGAFWWVFPEQRLGGSGGVCLGVVSHGVVSLTVCLAVVLARLSSCSFLGFPAALAGLRVSPGSGGVSSAHQLLIKVVDLDPVCGPVFCQFVVVVRLAVPPMGVLALRWWWCFHMAFGAMSRTMATFVVKASFQCVFLLCLSYALEELVVVGRVALPTCGESLSVDLESFQAVGAVVYCTLSMLVASCMWLLVAPSAHDQVVRFVPFGAWVHLFLVGLVRIALVELSTSACVLCAVVVRPSGRPVRATVGLSRCPGWARSGRSGGGRHVKVCNAMPRPVAFWGPEAKSLGPISLFPPLVPFLLSLLLSEGESFPLSGGSCVVARRRGARRRRSWHREGPFVGWFFILRIPAVCLPADVATAERVATSEEASPWSDVTLSRHGWPSR
ncbi:hypothetical protein Taro_015127 [Colocasia esculenta]|uniref:Uncharacterized protein n=1 Tax=Colocasia esculenta TaxID=4460 RepID=A0A843ULG8_COLES|nr:hypothetical protein [Colocasia esculenta]